MPGDNSGPGEFQLDGKRSFCPAIRSSGDAGNSNLYRWGPASGYHLRYAGERRDVYGQGYPDLQLKDLQLNDVQLSGLQLNDLQLNRLHFALAITTA